MAQYSVTWGCGRHLRPGLQPAVAVCLYPLFVRLWETDRDQVPRLAQYTARWLLAAALIVMLFLFLESDRLVILIFGPRYHEAVWLQKVLLFTVVFSFLHNWRPS